MPRTLTLAAYALVCTVLLAGGFVAGAIHAATAGGDPAAAAGPPSPGDRAAGSGALAVATDAPATPSAP